MKVLMFTLLFVSNISFAAIAREGKITIDDLKSIQLRVDKTEIIADVHYPNYRMGGGTSPGRQIVDCFVLDILDSDNEVRLEDKFAIVKQIRVLQGLSKIEEMQEIAPEVKGDKVIYKTDGVLYYVTLFAVTSRDGRNLSEVLSEVALQTMRGNRPSAINLLYVRDCRL